MSLPHPGGTAAVPQPDDCIQPGNCVWAERFPVSIQTLHYCTEEEILVTLVARLIYFIEDLCLSAFNSLNSQHKSLMRFKTKHHH